MNILYIVSRYIIRVSQCLFLLFSPSRDGGNFSESIYTNGQEYDNEDDPALLMVGGNRNDGSAVFGFDHVKEFCVRSVKY